MASTQSRGGTSGNGSNAPGQANADQSNDFQDKVDESNGYGSGSSSSDPSHEARVARVNPDAEKGKSKGSKGENDSESEDGEDSESSAQSGSNQSSPLGSKGSTGASIGRQIMNDTDNDAKDNHALAKGVAADAGAKGASKSMKGKAAHAAEPEKGKDSAKNMVKKDKQEQDEESDERAKNANRAQSGSRNGAHGMLKGVHGMKAMTMSLAALGMVAGAKAVGHSIWNGICHFFSNLWHGITAHVSAFFAGVGHILGIGAVGSAVTGTAFIGGAIGALATFAALLANMLAYNPATTGSIIEDKCQNAVEKADDNSGPSGDQAENDYAKKMWSVFKTEGLSNEQIAGILGNWSVESGIDPTSIETIGSAEQYKMGPRSKEAQSDWNSFVENKVFPAYASSGVSINKNAYKADDGKYYPGIGLAQWTGPSAKRLIDKAKAVNKNWYDLDFQIAYVLATGTSSTTGAAGGAKFFDTYKQQKGSASDMASYFAKNFEGNTSMAQSQRQSAAEDWAKKESGWSADSNYANSVLELASQMGASASDDHVANALATCKTSQSYNNSSLGSAALSYAYSNEKLGEGNDGTKMYRTVHDNVFPGDSYYQSCDRGVGAAVRWSGADDSYPAGPTDVQHSYLSSSPRWKKVIDGYKDSDKKLLEPGDIFVTQTNGHTFMYVGQPAVVSVQHFEDGGKPAKGSDMVSASFGQRSPGVGQLGNLTSYDSRPYDVFRLVNPQNSNKYKNAASSANDKK